MQAQAFEKSIILKYSVEPMGATTYLKTIDFPNTCTIIRVSMYGLGLIIIPGKKKAADINAAAYFFLVS